MTTTATTLDKETLSALCWRVLGTSRGGVMEQALNLNPGIASRGAVLPAGITVILPDVATDQPATLDVVQLWT
ncbi:tail protein X [Novosphingobium rosa]|uniref:tail protein X n=1 Tax=Novosphingobium rosa TaxID=76978 RepID=UPI000834F4A8|nr:tail protein X [Novosphingobium rosa]